MRPIAKTRLSILIVVPRLTKSFLVTMSHAKYSVFIFKFFTLHSCVACANNVLGRNKQCYTFEKVNSSAVKYANIFMAPVNWCFCLTYTSHHYANYTAGVFKMFYTVPILMFIPYFVMVLILRKCAPETSAIVKCQISTFSSTSENYLWYLVYV